MDQEDLTEFCEDFGPDFVEAAATTSTADEPAPADVYMKCLRERFGIEKFSPTIWKVISSIINNKQDNILVATRFDPRLCYQFPSVFLNTVTVVISPVISLMKKEVSLLTLSNIKACILETPDKRNVLLKDVYNFKYSLVYITPEVAVRLGKKFFKTLRPKLTLIAITKAQCISQGCLNYIPAFEKLNFLRRIIPEVPIVAITGATTASVREDVCSSLGLKNHQLTRPNFDIPNLEFAVEHKKHGSFWADVKSFLNKDITGVIVYCLTPSIAESVTTELRAHGFNCSSYLAGLPVNEQISIHEKFITNQIQVIVTTSSFGMDIDKNDVRLVIHYGSPIHMESYYEDISSAGRDGLPSKCIIFYNNNEDQTFREREIKDAILMIANLGMSFYIYGSECRRKFILEYFEGDSYLHIPKVLNCCDSCKSIEPIRFDGPFIQYGKLAKVATLNSFYKIFKSLIIARCILSVRRGKQSEMIASDKAMIQLAKLKPKNLDELRKANIDGFTEQKIMEFGDVFIKCILKKTKFPVNRIKKEKVGENSPATISASLSTDIRDPWPFDQPSTSPFAQPGPSHAHLPAPLYTAKPGPSRALRPAFLHTAEPCSCADLPAFLHTVKPCPCFAPLPAPLYTANPGPSRALRPAFLQTAMPCPCCAAFLQTAKPCLCCAPLPAPLYTAKPGSSRALRPAPLPTVLPSFLPNTLPATLPAENVTEERDIKNFPLSIKNEAIECKTENIDESPFNLLGFGDFLNDDAMKTISNIKQTIEDDCDPETYINNFLKMKEEQEEQSIIINDSDEETLNPHLNTNKASTKPKPQQIRRNNKIMRKYLKEYKKAKKLSQRSEAVSADNTMSDHIMQDKNIKKVSQECQTLTTGDIRIDDIMNDLYRTDIAASTANLGTPIVKRNLQE